MIAVPNTSTKAPKNKSEASKKKIEETRTIEMELRMAKVFPKAGPNLRLMD